MSDEAKPIGVCLIDPRSPAAALLRRAELLSRYQAVLKDWASSMPAGNSSLVDSLRVVNLRTGTIVIHAQHAAALTAVRFRLNELLRHFQNHFGTEYSRIDVRVRPAPYRN